jgi:hypothetical protein
LSTGGGKYTDAYGYLINQWKITIEHE